MSKTKKIALGVIATLAALIAGYVLYATQVANPKVAAELHSNPDGATARRVMLLTFADGRAIPVNYIREGDRVYAGADGPWWRTLRDPGQPVSVLIRGAALRGHARAVLDDPQQTEAVFSRLRPTVPAWLPDWLNGVLVVIELTPRS